MNYKNDLLMKKGDLILACAVLAIAGIALLFFNLRNSGDVVNITSDGKTDSYPLNVDKDIEIKGTDGSYNLVVIRDGKVKMQEANCKNQICVRHKAIYKDRESIICLPHRVYVEVESSEINETDN